MSFGKKLAGLFVEIEDDKSPSSKEKIDSKIIPLVPTIASSTYITGGTPSTNYGSVGGDEFKDHFHKLFEGSNLPGPDFFEFFNMIGTLQGQGLSEPNAYNAAYGALITMGLTKEKLLSSGKEYILIVEKDETDFKGELDGKKNQEIDAPKEFIESIKKLNEERMNKIAQLNAEMQEGANKITELSMQIAAKEQKLSQLTNGYSFANNAKKQQLEDVLNKINTYLNGK